MGGALAATLPVVDPVMDPESRAWVAALAGEGGDQGPSDGLAGP